MCGAEVLVELQVRGFYRSSFFYEEEGGWN
ncbi:hypothetical protein EMIT0194P_20493 [Pseudomonas serbica]